MIGKKIGVYGSGSYNVYKNFCDVYSTQVKFTDDMSIVKNFDEFEKIIFCCHQSSLYNNLHKYLLGSLKCKHVLYTRNFNKYPLYNTATNGFSVYKQYKFKNFLPIISFPRIITDSNKILFDNSLPIYGFYVRYMTPKSTQYVLDKLLQLKCNIVTCGNELQCFDKYNHYHTTNIGTFFNSIDNYVHIGSDYIDPIPNTLLEAIYNKKNIIYIKLNEKLHCDGCEDILSIFRYSNSFVYNEENIAYNEIILSMFLEKLKIFYKHIIYNNFSYSLDKDRYSTFKEWLFNAW